MRWLGIPPGQRRANTGPGVTNMVTQVSNGVQHSPAHVWGKRGHVDAWRAQPAFPVTAKLELIAGTTNPWRAAESNEFYAKVLTQAKTVQQAIDLGKSLMGLSPARVQAHLRWLFAWNGRFIEVDGKRWSAARPTAPVVPKARKAKAVA